VPVALTAPEPLNSPTNEPPFTCTVPPFAYREPPVSVPTVNVPVFVSTPLLSDPFKVRIPEFVAVAEAKSLAVAVAPEMMLSVPPLTAFNAVVPAFNVNKPETTFPMLLLPVPFSVKAPPLSEPLNVAAPRTLTVP
jgi:hypothetical protein